MQISNEALSGLRRIQQICAEADRKMILIIPSIQSWIRTSATQLMRHLDSIH